MTSLDRLRELCWWVKSSNKNDGELGQLVIDIEVLFSELEQRKKEIERHREFLKCVRDRYVDFFINT